MPQEVQPPSSHLVGTGGQWTFNETDLSRGTVGNNTYRADQNSAYTCNFGYHVSSYQQPNMGPARPQYTSRPMGLPAPYYSLPEIRLPQNSEQNQSRGDAQGGARRESLVPLMVQPSQWTVPPPEITPAIDMGEPHRKIPCKMPGYFDGKNWSEWYGQFKRVSLANGWNDETKKVQLYASCNGAARIATDEFDLTRGTYAQLVTGLCKIFDTRSYRDRFTAFRQRVQGQEEDPSIYAMAILGISKEAFPGIQDQFLGQMVTEQFIAGLRDPDMRRKVFDKRPQDLEEAMTLCNHLMLTNEKYPEGEDSLAAYRTQGYPPRGNSRGRGRGRGGRGRGNNNNANVPADTKSTTPPPNVVNRGRGNSAQRARGRGGNSTTQSPLRGTGRGNTGVKRNVFCLACGQAGHWMSNCRKIIQPQNRGGPNVGALLEAADEEYAEEFSDEEDAEAENSEPVAT